MIKDEVSLLDREIAIAKSLLTMAIQHCFLFLRGKGNGKLPFWRIDNLLNLDPLPYLVVQAPLHSFPQQNFDVLAPISQTDG